VSARVQDGATLQVGIGTIPDATLAGLTGRRGLRIWSEMFSDGVLALEEGGALDPAATLTASFLLGSPRLYGWVHRNPRVQVLRT
jgi:acyl-CoA hydrolase